MKRKKKLICFVLILFTFIFYTWMAFQIPYTHDDWDWGLPLGIQHLFSADINSRYAGNLIEVMLTRSFLLKSIFMGAVFAAIPFFASELTGLCLNMEHGEENAISVQLCTFAIANFALLSLPADVWCQTNGWVAGFSNFVVSGLAMLVFWYLIAGYTVDDKAEHNRRGYSPWRKWMRILLLFLFGLVMQLFLENLALFFLCCSLVFACFSVIRKRKACLPAFALLAGNIAGLFVMFSSSIYQSLWNTGYAIGEYRQLMYDKSQPLQVFLSEAAHRFFGEFVPVIIGHHSLLTGTIAALLVLICLHECRCQIHDKWPAVGKLLLCFVNVVFAVYYIYGYLRSVPAFIMDVPSLHIGIDIAFLCLITCEIFILFKGRQLMLPLYAVWFSAFLMMAPMVAINTVGPRSYYTTTLCLIVFCQILLGSYLLESGRTILIIGLPVCLVLFLAFAMHMGKIYEAIGIVTRQRYEIVREAEKGRPASICMPEYPFKQYLWVPDPNGEPRISYFREFYGIPESVELTFESHMKK